LSTSSEVTVLLMLEAIDKASQIIEGISGKLEALGDKASEAAAKASMTGEELEAAQVKAEAAANAYSAAVDEQDAAQARLLESTQAVRDLQDAAAESAAKLAEADAAVASGVEDAANIAQVSYADIAAAADASAAAVKAAIAEQTVALDALGTAQKEAALRSDESAAAQDAANTSTDVSGVALKGLAVASAVTAAAVAGIGYESVKAAANFQQATTVLQTSGGETAAQMASVRAGILNISSATGTGIQELVNGMYMIGSAGYTGAKGLTVLTAAAQGAKAENADLSTVSNALTTVLKDYGMGANQATAAMDQMIAVVQNGKTTTEALAGSLSAVLPVAAAAKLSFGQVGGAMATMTGEGMSAQQSAQDLANVIRSLQNPTSVATNEMMQMGLNSNTVAQQLGKQGLTGTLAELTSAITSHMGANGQILMSTFQNASAAAADAKTEISSMPASLQGLANSFLSGSISAKTWRTDLQGLDPVQSHLMTQFAGTAEKANSFNSMLTSGQYGSQTYTAALSKMLGGATGLNVGLMLTGKNMATFQSNVKAVGDAGAQAGTDVNGWAAIQGNMNQKLSELKQTVEAASISLGTALLPMVTKILDVVMKILTPIANWIEHNQKLAAVILLVVGALATGITVFVMAAKAITMIRDAMVVFQTMTEGLEFNPVILAITAIALVALLIVTHWSTVKKWFSDFWGWFKGIFNDAKSFVAKWWPELLAPMTGGMSIVAKFIMDHWTQIFSFLKGIWNDLVTAWDDTGGALITDIVGAWTEVSDAVSKEWDKISSDLSSIWQSLTTIWNATGGKLVSLISDNWSKITAAFRDAFGPIVALVRMNWAIMSGVFKAAWDAIRGVVQVGWDLLVGIFRAAWDVISSVVHAGWDVISGVFKASGDVIVGLVKWAWDSITTMINVALDLIKGTFQFFADLFTGKWGKLWGDIKSMFSSVWNDIAGFFKNILGDIESTVSGAVSSIWRGFIGAIETAISGIGKALDDVWHSIVHAFDDASTWLLDAGKAIINGLINGVKNMAGQAVQAVKNVGSDIIKGAKSVLSIFSPSKEFSDIGEMTMAGMVQGIAGAAPTVNAAMRNAMKGLTGPSITASVVANAQATGTQLGVAVASGLGGAASTGGVGGGTTVNQYFSGNYIISDSEITKFAQMVGSKVVTTIGPQGGVKTLLR
jgi:TP901 family phage tail tape measure protein